MRTCKPERRPPKMILASRNIKEEPADEHMYVKAERAEDDVRVKEEPLKEDAHI